MEAARCSLLWGALLAAAVSASPQSPAIPNHIRDALATLHLAASPHEAQLVHERCSVKLVFILYYFFFDLSQKKNRAVVIHCIARNTGRARRKE